MTDFDSLIDAAAREMTAEPSPVDLRARVVREIGNRTTEAVRQRARWHSAAIWPLLAAAGIILAVYLGWPERPLVQLPNPPPVVQTHDGPRPAPAVSTETRPLTPVPARLRPVPRASEPTIASIPALEVPEAIGIAPLDATSEPVPALDVVAPLEVEQLNIKPLTPPGQAVGGQ